MLSVWSIKYAKEWAVWGVQFTGGRKQSEIHFDLLYAGACSALHDLLAI